MQCIPKQCGLRRKIRLLFTTLGEVIQRAKKARRDTIGHRVVHCGDANTSKINTDTHAHKTHTHERFFVLLPEWWTQTTRTTRLPDASPEVGARRAARWWQHTHKGQADGGRQRMPENTVIGDVRLAGVTLEGDEKKKKVRGRQPTGSIRLGHDSESEKHRS